MSNKYRAVKEQGTGQWLVEKVEPFFDMPIVMNIVKSRATAFYIVKQLRSVPFRLETTAGLCPGWRLKPDPHFLDLHPAAPALPGPTSGDGFGLAIGLPRDRTSALAFNIPGDRTAMRWLGSGDRLSGAGNTYLSIPRS